MSHEIDPVVQAVYRAAAREAPSELADARVLAASRLAPAPSAPRLLWAEAAAAALLIGATAFSLAHRPGPPSPDDPLYFGLYAGREESVLLALGPTAHDPFADALLRAGRPSPTLKE